MPFLAGRCQYISHEMWFFSVFSPCNKNKQINAKHTFKKCFRNRGKYKFPLCWARSSRTVTPYYGPISQLYDLTLRAVPPHHRVFSSHMGRPLSFIHRDASSRAPWLSSRLPVLPSIRCSDPACRLLDDSLTLWSGMSRHVRRIPQDSSTTWPLPQG